MFRRASDMTDSAIRLTLLPPQQAQDWSYQLLQIDLATRDRIIEPSDLAPLQLPDGIDTSIGVVLSGRAPVWLFSYLVHELHPTVWVACYDPRLGAVVVATRQTQIGQVLPVSLARGKPHLCPAVLIVGPPDSGKSVLSHALFQALLPDYPEVYLQRAQWDGEGNWILELDTIATACDREDFKLGYKGSLTPSFFPYHARAILDLRRQKQLVLVDVGGKVQPEKVPILEACSHYVVISAQPDKVQEWHEFCRERGNLKPLAVIHSTLDSMSQIHQRQPHLEITCGPWLQSQPLKTPAVLLEQFTSVLAR